MSLSIIVPTINRESLLHTINSVKAQTIPTEILVEWDENHIGAGPMRNQMIQKVKTTWVGFCDDDDWLDPHYHEWLRKIRGADMVIFQMQRPEGMILPGHTDIDRLAYNWVGVSFAMRTAVALKYPFKNMLGEDFDLIQRAVKAGLRLEIDPRVGYFVG